MAKRTTIIWVHGMGDSQLGFSRELRDVLCGPFQDVPGVAEIVHEEIVYEDINEQASKKIRDADLGISRLCGEVTIPLIGALDQYTDGVKDALGDVFPDWLSRGIRLWIFQRFNREVLRIQRDARRAKVTPAEHNINIVCHSLGTFLTYEFLHWAKDVFEIGAANFRANNVFMLAPVISIMKDLRLGSMMSSFDLAINNPLSKPWVHNPATGAPVSNIRKLWAYRHKLDPFASIVPLRGELLDHPAWTFDDFHTGPNMHAYTNYLTEFRQNILERVLDRRLS